MTTTVENHRLFDMDTALRIMDYIIEGYTHEEAVALAERDESIDWNNFTVEDAVEI